MLIHKKYISTCLFLSILLTLSSCKDKNDATATLISENVMDLSGDWRVQLDSLDIGESEAWFSQPFKKQTISLPGTLDDAGIGTADTLTPALNNYVLSNLARKHSYIGKAWYQKEIEIPENWTDKEIQLSMERVMWRSTVYVDETKIDSRESLVGSHDYDLTTALTPGKHQLTVVVDNSNLYPFINVLGDKYPMKVNQEMAHGYTNHTQIKWNGILGNMRVIAFAKAEPSNLQLYPDFENGMLDIAFEQRGGTLDKLKLEIEDVDGNSILSQQIQKPVREDDNVEFSIAIPETMKEWDEFNPKVYTVKLTSDGSTVETVYGHRKIENKDAQLTLNGHRIFLRGNLECVIFPLTGYPPMDKDSWATLIDQAQNYGLNHLRFHSWCPPKAAFEAADEAGFYLQVELPHWSLEVGEDANTTAFLKSEANKMLSDYGNHPSFVLMSMGNELQGNMEVLNEMTRELQAKDNRRLYATTSFSFQKPSGTRPEAADDFFIAQWTDRGWIRGQGVFNDYAPSFDDDFSKNSDHIDVPLISHEIGQYSVYPDLSEIPNYTGVLKPLNFIAVKNDLEKKGLLDLAPEFTQASGKLAAMLYKEEIERALKTDAFDGFQLLQLQDFPGQGTALVGLLNAFWESKGVITGKEFRRFNSEVVPLARFEKAVYTSGETFMADVEIANFFKPMENQKINWSIKSTDGSILKEESFTSSLILGNNRDLAKINVPIKVDKAQKLEITIGLEGTEHENSWSIWAYPNHTESIPNDIVLTTSFEEAEAALEAGKKVFFNPSIDAIKGIKGRFVPVFWSPVHFPDQPGTMGLLIDDKHAALSNFPTSTHTDWNWWDLCIQSKSVNLGSTGLKPIVRVIDNFVTNQSLANIFEAKVGNGTLLFTSIDLQNDLKNRPAAKQLKNSLIKYMNTADFNPKAEVEFDFIKSMKESSTK